MIAGIAGTLRSTCLKSEFRNAMDTSVRTHRASPVRRMLRSLMFGNLTRLLREHKRLRLHEIRKSRILPQSRKIGILENLFHSLESLRDGALQVFKGSVDSA